MVGIAILNYNNLEDTLACLESVSRFTPKGSYKICLVDNASRPEVRDSVAASIGPDVEYIVNDSNLGYARGNNVALKYFDTCPEVDKVLILNNDVILTMDILTPLSEYLDSDPTCGVVSPLLYSSAGKIDQACARRQKSTRDFLIKSTSLGRLGFKTHEFLLVEKPELLSQESIATELPSGSCMMLRKKDFAQVGFFDPSTFLYFEEDILYSKLKSLGLRTILLPKFTAIHLGARTTAKSQSGFIYSCYRDSMLHFLDNYSSVPSVLRWYIRARTGIASKFKSL